jgi:nucleotide-binding universal stress UspA family protein
MLRSIFIGLDGSPCSSTAVDLGIRWARPFKASLVGLGIVDQPCICRPEPTGIGGSEYKKRRDAHLVSDARGQVEDFLKQFKAVQAVGHPHQQILREGQQSDLILLGQHPRFHFETQKRDTDTIPKVIMNSPRPVVVVPDTLPSGEGVIVAYDCSPPAARALQAFVASGLAEGKDIHVVSVHPDAQAAQQHAERAVEYLHLHDIPAQSHAVATRKDPAQVLLDGARQHRVGVLVMGAYGRSRLREFLRGSTTRSLLRESEVPLFVCH